MDIMMTSAVETSIQDTSPLLTVSTMVGVEAAAEAGGAAGGGAGGGGGGGGGAGGEGARRGRVVCRERGRGEPEDGESQGEGSEKLSHGGKAFRSWKRMVSGNVRESRGASEGVL